jgi:hypothetical protein
MDDLCPNASEHCAPGAGTSGKHAMSAPQVERLLMQHIADDLSSCCMAVTALERDSLPGKYVSGAIGTLFKVEVPGLGYTFVAKGTRMSNWRLLQHEAQIYQHLDSLQGQVVPVFLGLYEIPGKWGFVRCDGTVLKYLMAMSWGGIPVRDNSRAPSNPGMYIDDHVRAEIDRAFQALYDAGVDHGDRENRNVLWNLERGRAMVVDFDRAVLVKRPTSRRQPMEGGDVRE